MFLAVGVRFELTILEKGYRISSAALSSAQPPHPDKLTFTLIILHLKCQK